MTRESGNHQADGRSVRLYDFAPNREQWGLAAGVVLVLASALVVTVPFAAQPLPASLHRLLPAYGAAILVNEVLTAVLLLAACAVQRSRALLVLAIGYLFSGLMVIPWVSTFPGIFAPLGLFGAGLQATAWVAALRRIALPLSITAYAVLAQDDRPAWRERSSLRGVIVVAVAGTLIAAVILTLVILRCGDLLPHFMADKTHAGALWRYVPAAAMALSLFALWLLWTGRRSLLDMWLAITLCASIVEIVLLAYLSSGRFSLGWWAGRAYGLAAASVVLVALLAETTTLHARLVRAVAAERRERQEHLTTLEALSAAVAHEVNQPLASMVTNADAGLRWLAKAEPEVEEARNALRRIVSDGHRAGDVIQSIRAMARREGAGRGPVDVNAIIEEVVILTYGEARVQRVSVLTDLTPNLPPVMGNPVQLQQVIANLVTNAIDAMSAVTDRRRMLRIGSAWDAAAGTVTVFVEDTGVGLPSHDTDRIFDAFYSTKPAGMGLGLILCRTIIEANGGRLWVSANQPHGAVFHFSLPCDRPTATLEAVQ